MSTASRKQFRLRPYDEPIGSVSNHQKYYRYTHQLLPQLEAKCAQVIEAWPVPQDQPLQDGRRRFPELYELVDERDQLSDSIRIYAAMAVEGFLNWYGLFRLGETVFNEHFERLPLFSKAKTLVLVCDHVTLAKTDPLLTALDQVAQSRNALVHPKAKEVESIAAMLPVPHSKVPATAKCAVENMESFFREFASAVPAAEGMIPQGLQ